MTTDRHGREWRGNADAETIDEHCDFDDRLDLAAEIRAAMPHASGGAVGDPVGACVGRAMTALARDLKRRKTAAA